MTFRSTKIERLISFLVSVLSVRLYHGVEIRLPVNYTALTGDLEIHVQNLTPQNEPYYLHLLEYYPHDNSFTRIGSTLLLRSNSSNATAAKVYKTKFPCGLIVQGGRYGVRIQFDVDGHINEVLLTVPDDDRGSYIDGNRHKNYIVNLDVRWPPVVLSIEPSEIETYPETSVTASVAFSQSYCQPSIGSPVPETWISLIYCGHSKTDCLLDKISHKTQVLYSEQIRGYPSLLNIQLKCCLFGQAGYYTLYLTSDGHATGTVIATLQTSSILHTKWSEKFVFNVHTRSIFQCDAHGGGVAVLFQYPDCILSNDKIRLYGSLRADVASSLPPTSLHYITEQKVIKGKYSLHFDCDLFSEKFVEYCFVYVNEAITGAVSDVRIDCVPTFPVSDKDAGQWGSWSEWSECSSTCRGGTRSRYRFCDSPSPKYGAKYCEGHSVETAQCGNSTSWVCQLYDAQIMTDLLDEQPTTQEVVGNEECLCGCNVHLNADNPQRVLIASLRNCSHRVWWKIQADPYHTIQLYMNRAHFPCVTQKLKIHDGEFVSSNLLAQLTSTNEVALTNFSVMSSSSVILLQYSLADNLDNFECAGGFLCHFRQKAVDALSRTTLIHAESMSAEITVDAVHIAISVMLVTVISMSLCMIIQYVNRYYKYQRASMNDDLITDSEYSDSVSKQNFAAIISHETSMSTLVSEFIPLKKLRNTDSRSDSMQNDGQLERDSQNTSSSQSDNEEQTREPKLRKTLENFNGVQRSSLYVFRAEIHDKKRVDGSSESCKSPNSSSGEGITESPSSPTTGDKTTESRRPSTCTRSSISSSVSPSFSSHTNVAPSPNSSVRGLTLKRIKDIRNQERMMVGSDFSLTSHDTDLEMDYYDYNVHNTSAVPGSYLGMDPAYCVWIPPFAPGQWMDNGTCSDDENSSSINNDIEMQVLDNGDESRSETPYSEKFQKECRTREKERFKRHSCVSTTSSDNRTIVAGDITPDDDLTIKDALLPDSRMVVHQAYVIKDSEQVIPLLEKNDLPFADDDDEDDSDTAYDSDSDEKKKGVLSDRQHGRLIINETTC